MHFYVCGDGSQHRIPRRMAEGVINGLEIVDVDERDREGSFIAKGAVDLHLGQFAEIAHIQHAGEKVSAGQDPFVLHGPVQSDDENRQQKESQAGSGVPYIGEQIDGSIAGPKIDGDPDARTQDCEYQPESLADCPGNQTNWEQIEQREGIIHSCPVVEKSDTTQQEKRQSQPYWFADLPNYLTRLHHSIKYTIGQPGQTWASKETDETVGAASFSPPRRGVAEIFLISASLRLCGNAH
jgi:hypothetical protein